MNTHIKMTVAQDDIDTAIKVVREGLVGVVNAASPQKLIRIAALIERIENREPAAELASFLDLLQAEARKQR
jgi:hypothetical protein